MPNMIWLLLLSTEIANGEPYCRLWRSSSSCVGNRFEYRENYQYDTSGDPGTASYVDGFFGTAVPYVREAMGSSTPAFLDVDNDGAVELVVGSARGDVLLFKRRKNVTLNAPLYQESSFDDEMTTLISGKFTNSTPAAMDLNDDGLMDIVVGTGDGKLYVLMNQDGENFTVSEDSSLNLTVASHAAPAFDDLDNDGDADLIIGDGAGWLGYFENDRGRFVRRRNVRLKVDGGAKPQLVDYDDDGDVDLFVGEATGRIRLFENVGSKNFPLFVATNDHPLGFVSADGACAPAFSDIDGDGFIDCVYGTGGATNLRYLMNRQESRNDGVPFYYWRSDGRLFAMPVENPMTVPTFVGLDDVSLNSETPFSDVIGTSPAFADIDSDHRIDLLMGNADGTISYYLNAGTSQVPSFPVRTILNDKVSAHSAPVAVTTNHSVDLLVGSDNDGLVYFRNVGNATFQRAEDHPFRDVDVGQARRTVPAFGDFDGDERPELLVGSDNGKIMVFRNYEPLNAPPLYRQSSYDDYAAFGDGSVLEAYTVVATTNSQEFRQDEGTFEIVAQNQDIACNDDDVDSSCDIDSAPAFFDVDRDGLLDLVVGNAKGELFFYYNFQPGENPDWDDVSDNSRFVDDRIAFGNPFASISVGSHARPAFMDLDGDQDLDCVVGTDFGLVVYINGFCTSACSGNGVCDTSTGYYSDATCNCLIGFSGDQCASCQDGYFGLDCDLCPEGGNELRDRPRLTDTCGRAGSGRSRGTCDDTRSGSGRCDCFEDNIFSGPSCDEGDCPRGTFESADLDGLYYNASCVDCPQGRYTATFGQLSCDPCVAPLTTKGPGSISCDACLENYFFHNNECKPCASGMDCSKNGGDTLEDVRLNNGRWRTSIHSETIERCPLDGACQSSDDGFDAGEQLCTRGHRGPMCASQCRNQV